MMNTSNKNRILLLSQRCYPNGVHSHDTKHRRTCRFFISFLALLATTIVGGAMAVDGDRIEDEVSHLFKTPRQEQAEEAATNYDRKRGDTDEAIGIDTFPSPPEEAAATTATMRVEEIATITTLEEEEEELETTTITETETLGTQRVNDTETTHGAFVSVTTYAPVSTTTTETNSTTTAKASTLAEEQASVVSLRFSLAVYDPTKLEVLRSHDIFDENFDYIQTIVATALSNVFCRQWGTASTGVLNANFCILPKTDILLMEDTDTTTAATATATATATTIANATDNNNNNVRRRTQTETTTTTTAALDQDVVESILQLPPMINIVDRNSLGSTTTTTSTSNSNTNNVLYWTTWRVTYPIVQVGSYYTQLAREELNINEDDTNNAAVAETSILSMQNILQTNVNALIDNDYLDTVMTTEMDIYRKTHNVSNTDLKIYTSAVGAEAVAFSPILSSWTTTLQPEQQEEDTTTTIAKEDEEELVILETLHTDEEQEGEDDDTVTGDDDDDDTVTGGDDDDTVTGDDDGDDDDDDATNEDDQYDDDEQDWTSTIEDNNETVTEVKPFHTLRVVGIFMLLLTIVSLSILIFLSMKRKKLRELEEQKLEDGNGLLITHQGVDDLLMKSNDAICIEATNNDNNNATTSNGSTLDDKDVTVVHDTQREELNVVSSASDDNNNATV